MSYLQELQRRNVFKVAIAYVVVAWLIVQVVETVFPAFGYGDASIRIAVIVLGIGFIPALILAWAFEVTPEGVKKEKDVDRSQSITHKTGRKINALTIALLVLAIAVFAVDQLVPDNAIIGDSTTDTQYLPRVQGVSDKSVAVLPFANRSTKEEDTFFVDGIHDDILTQLARIGSLTVISRTSVEKFKGTTQSIREIGAVLGVKSILEGGVQRAGDRVRINVQLIDVATDDHLWANTYDRELTTANIFDIQSEIATFIAEALKATLSTKEQAQLATVPTGDMAALEAYFLGRQAWARRTAASLETAEENFKRAIELDPDYALAYVDLANTYHFQTFYSNRPAQEAKSLIEPLVEKALMLNDELGEAYYAMTWVVDEPEAKEALFRKGVALSPGYVSGHQWYGQFLDGQSGRQREGLVQLEEAARLDPLSGIIRAALGDVLMKLERFDEARNQYESVTRIDPGFAFVNLSLALLEVRAYGRGDDAITWLREAIALDPGSPRYRARLAVMWSLIGADDDADQSLARARAMSPDGIVIIEAGISIGLDRGEIAQVRADATALHSINPRRIIPLLVLSLSDVRSGHAEGALARYSDAFPELVNDAGPVLDRWRINQTIRLAWLMQQTGDSERADMLLAHVMDFIKTIPRMGQAGYQIADAQVFALRGMKDEALVALRHAVDVGWRLRWRFYLQHDPILASLHDEPEYQAIINDVEADVAAQLARVRAMEASGELAAIPE